jgi:CYTH domain-containing protein
MQSSAQTKQNSDREMELEALTEMESRKGGRESSKTARDANGEQLPEAYLPPKKVERKFLVADIPAVLNLASGTRVEQGYLAVERDGSEVRIRKTPKGASLFVKNAAGAGQVEVEVPLVKDQFLALWPLTEGRRMSKVTHNIDVADIPFTLDLYEGQLDWLRIAEAEFPGPTAAEAFTPPAWFKREVSDLPAYRHSNLARE